MGMQQVRQAHGRGPRWAAAIALGLALPWGVALGDDISRQNVYQKIRDADANAFTFQRRGSGGSGAAAAQLVLSEQGEAPKTGQGDAANENLVFKIDTARLGTGTYPEFIKLLDNYEFLSNKAESTTAAEQAEIKAFLDKAMQTGPMKVALAYINDELNEDLTPAQFRDRVQKMWFEIFTHHFGTPRANCTGFEHVFVGEGNGGSGAGQISGYHSWVKFYLDEKRDLVNYLGQRYELHPSKMPANPTAITIRMTEKFDEDGPGPKPARTFVKNPRGGFFVGISPECQMAMGAVALFEVLEGGISNDTRRTTIDGGVYDLVLHPGNGPGGQPDKVHIRSFFPTLVGRVEGAPAGGGGGNDGGGAAPVGDGNLAIVRALPNPPGDDATGEWIEVKNVGDDPVDLADYALADKAGGTLKLSGTLPKGETRRFDIDRSRDDITLGNNGGEIKLIRDGESVSTVQYGRAASGQVVTFGGP